MNMIEYLTRLIAEDKEAGRETVVTIQTQNGTSNHHVIGVDSLGITKRTPHMHGDAAIIELLPWHTIVGVQVVERGEPPMPDTRLAMLKEKVQAIAAEMDDDTDGEARCPTGDDWNDLFNLVMGA